MSLPDLDSPYPLSAEQIEEYQRNGHILLRGVCTPEEVAAYRPVIADAVERFKAETRPLAERDTYGKAFLQISNIWVSDDAVRRFVMGKRFGRIAADLMKVDGVRIYHDQALFKEPGGGHTPWHQDQFYWPLATPNTITMWMPMVDAPMETGAMAFASGSHRDGFLANIGISDESESHFRREVAQRRYPIHCGELGPGDATFHAGWTLHKAAGNTRDYVREVMTIIWHDAETTISEPANDPQRNDLANWLPGLAPGDKAASKLNPVAFERSAGA